MNLKSIPQVYRNANRWREILSVLSKHGLSDWLDRFDLPLAQRLLNQPLGEDGERLSREERIRLALEELGPAFIKLGQVLATRPDQVGVELAEELTKLQSSAPAESFEAMRATIESELGKTIEESFLSIEEQPVASASIGQVHRGQTLGGRVVAVKVRHTGVAEQLDVDSDVLIGLAELAERIPELALYRPLATAQEFRRSLLREIDFNDERQRIERFRQAFEGDERIHIPEPFPECSAEQVLTLEWLEGYKLSEPDLAEKTGADLSLLARNGAEVFLEMIFEHGLYHADPHPGNLMVLEGNVLGLLDFGMVGRISEQLQEDLEDVLLALAADDSQQLTSALLRIGTPPPGLDEDAFAADVDEFVDRYGNQDLARFNLTGALTELFSIVQRHAILLSSQLSMLLKLLIMLEGTAQLLSPDFSMLEVLEPIQRRMIQRRLSPKRQLRKVRRIFTELELLAEQAPRQLRELLGQVQSGRFEVQLEHRGLEPSVNRLVLGLITCALIVAGAQLLSSEVWLVRGVSVPGAAALTLAALLGLRLWRAISKSGRFDSH